MKRILMCVLCLFKCPKSLVSGFTQKGLGHPRKTESKVNWAWVRLQAGRKATPLDVEIDPLGMDLTTDQGFSNALYHIANLEPGAGSMSAPVCSTFVFMKFG